MRRKELQQGWKNEIQDFLAIRRKLVSIRLDKPWTEFSKQSVSLLTGHLGVYQLGNAREEIIYIGVANARSRFGLRGELEKWLTIHGIEISFFRVEVTMAYKTRHAELMQTFLHDFKRLPLVNGSMNVTSLGSLKAG